MKTQAYRFCDGRLDEIAAELALTPCEGLAWLHIEGTGPDVVEWLRATAHLPQIVVGALTATETRPRCEAIGDGALVNLRGLAADPAQAIDSLASIRIYATRGVVVSVGRVELSATPHVTEKMKKGMLKDPGDLVTAFAVAITHLLDPQVAGLGDSLDDCELELDQRDSWRFRRAVGAARRKAIDYRRFVQPQREALDRLARLDCAWLEAADRQHLTEAADRFARMTEELESIRERAALVQDQLADVRAETLERRSLLLSVAALVFLPLTFFTGLLGMNVQGIPYADEPWAFWGVVGLCVLLSAALVGWFAATNWFRK